MISVPDSFNVGTIYLLHKDCNKISKGIGRKKNRDGTCIRRKHKILTSDSCIFIVQFQDGLEKDMTYNILFKHFFSQADSEKNQYQLFKVGLLDEIEKIALAIGCIFFENL